MTPPARLGENAPAWLCPSAPSFRSPHLTTRIDADPTPEQLARKARLAAEAEARRVAREAEHAEKLRVNAERKADEKRRRAELAAQNKAADLARRAEERRKAQAARIAAKAAKPKPPKRSPGGSRAPAAPAGYVGLPEAARRVGRSRTCLHVAAQEGRLPVARKGRYVYVRMEDVAAYLEEARKGQRANQERNLSRARAERIARAKRPWAKLCPRKRGAA